MIALRPLVSVFLGVILSGSLRADASSGSEAPSTGVQPMQLVVEDGQILTHDFTVFVTTPLTSAMAPKLHFSGSHFLGDAGPLLTDAISPLLVAPHQFRVITVGDTPVTVEGTLLTFNLSHYHIPFYKAATRLLPSLEWTAAAQAGRPPETDHIVAVEEVYLGNLVGAALWTFVTVLCIGLTIIGWSVRESQFVTKFPPRPALLLITGSDGYLSLWRTQLLLWTVAVGSVVFLFGLLRLHVPDIPDTLVALMGMSLLTGTLSSAKSRIDTADKQTKQTQKIIAASAAPFAATQPLVMPPIVRTNPHPASWAELISLWNDATGQVELSIPKAQMVFWTIVILVLFVVKSFLLGALWPVPWPMVALTGMSQAGYIGDKYVQSISGRT